MKYTYINAAGEQVKAEIEDKKIREYVKEYGLTNKEAIYICLNDMGYLDDETVHAIRGKMTQVTLYGKKPRKTRERKPDLVKRDLIEKIYNLIAAEADSAVVKNPERLIGFTIDDDNYEITLSKKRRPKAQRSADLSFLFPERGFRCKSLLRMRETPFDSILGSNPVQSALRGVLFLKKILKKIYIPIILYHKIQILSRGFCSSRKKGRIEKIAVLWKKGVQGAAETTAEHVFDGKAP